MSCNTLTDLRAGVFSPSVPVLWLLLQEYLRLSDVYRMYGNASMQPLPSSLAALHCLSLSAPPALPCEVERFPALSHSASLTKTSNVPVCPVLTFIFCSLLVYKCAFNVCLCEGVYHSQSIKPDIWDAEGHPLIFLLYSIIPTCFV